MVVDIGGGTSETALVSLGGIVALQAVRVGSFDLDASIVTYIRREYGIAIGEQTAEEIKIAIGSAAETEGEFCAEVRGRELMSGLPRTVVLTPDEVRGAISEQVETMVESVVTCLGEAPPELAQDLLAQGIHLVGGGAMLRGLDLRLANATGVPVQLVRQPLESVVLGAGRVIENYEQLKVMFMDARS
jgi:rod shape-determining protein MreB